MRAPTLRRTPLEAWIAAQLGLADGFTRPDLETRQLALLRETVAHAARSSPFHRRRLAHQGPGVPASLAGLGALPFTTARELCEHGPALLCVSQDEVSRVVTLDSSGTSGAPKRLWFAAEDQTATVDFFEAGMSALVGAGDRVLILLPGRTWGSVGALLATALRRSEAIPIVHGSLADVPAALEVLRRERPTSVVGAPVQVLALLRHAEAAGTPLTLRTALLSTDRVPAGVVRQLAEDFGCEVFEHYGMTEMGLGGAVDCAAHAGYHLRDADLYFEVVDPVSGAVLPDGVEGEVVFTTLRRRCMPLVRYRTGDRARLLAGPCPCGSALRRLDRVDGRLDAAAVDPEGEVRLAQLDEVLFRVRGLVDFGAAVSGDGGARRLSLTAWGVRPDPALARAVEASLELLDPVVRARRSGALEVAVQVAPLPDHPWPRPVKRTLCVTGGAPGRPPWPTQPGTIVASEESG